MTPPEFDLELDGVPARIVGSVVALEAFTAELERRCVSFKTRIMRPRGKPPVYVVVYLGTYQVVS